MANSSSVRALANELIETSSHATLLTEMNATDGTLVPRRPRKVTVRPYSSVPKLITPEPCSITADEGEVEQGAKAALGREAPQRPKRENDRRIRQVERTRPNQVWQSDLTKICAGPAVGRVYLAKI